MGSISELYPDPMLDNDLISRLTRSVQAVTEFSKMCAQVRAAALALLVTHGPRRTGLVGSFDIAALEKR